MSLRERLRDYQSMRLLCPKCGHMWTQRPACVEICDGRVMAWFGSGVNWCPECEAEEPPMNVGHELPR